MTTRSYKKGKTTSSKTMTSVSPTICNKLGEDTGGDHLGQQQGKVTPGNVRKTMMCGRSTVSVGSDKETLVQTGNECSTTMSDGNVILCDDDGKRYGADCVILFQF